MPCGTRCARASSSVSRASARGRLPRVLACTRCRVCCPCLRRRSARPSSAPSIGLLQNCVVSQKRALRGTYSVRIGTWTYATLLRRPHGARARADGGGDRPGPSSAGAALLPPRSRHGESRCIPIPRSSARGTYSVRIGTCDVRDTLAAPTWRARPRRRRGRSPRPLESGRQPSSRHAHATGSRGASRFRAHPRVGHIRSE